jgi:hypothetical protein
MNFSVPDPSGICVVLGKKKEKVDILLLLLPAAKATTPQSQQAKKKIGKRKRDCLTTNKHL